MIPTSRVTVSFILTKRSIGDQQVAALAEFWVDPKGEGIGKEILKAIVAYANPMPVVGFADKGVERFYAKCGWYLGGKHDGKTLVASCEIDDSKLECDLW